MPSRETQRIAIELPWRTILKVFAAGALVWVWLRTWELFLLVLVAVLLAVTLDPVVRWVTRLGLARWAAATLVVFATLALIVVVGVFVSRSLPDQSRLVADRLTAVERALADRVPLALRSAIGSEDPTDLVQRYVAPLALKLAAAITSAALVLLLAFILTLYLLIEGRATWRWVLAFVPLSHRRKVDQTAVESQRVIFGYVAGNLATSAFATAFVLVSLSTLHVPAAMLLAILAGVCDFVPVLGFIVSAIPALVLALAVSPGVAFAVVALYAGYHTIENYFIAPWVYGDRLRLSNVAVVMAFAVGASLAGVVGALVALPIAAAYPAIERIWLRERLGDRVVREHTAIEGS
jgi:predicted PurR-regulated permease PerM